MSPRAVRRRTLLTGLLGAGAAVAGCSAAGLREEVTDVAARFASPGPTPSGDPSGPHPVATPLRLPYAPPDGPPTASTVGDLVVPQGVPGRLPVVVLVHGGGWTMPTDLTYLSPLAVDLASHGVAVWNVEYRRVGGGGGWPTTLTDVAAAVDAVAGLPGRTGLALDTADVHVAGHSAGGHLAAWVAGRGRLPAGAPGSGPLVEVRSALTVAGVLDLALAVERGKDRFVRGFLGGTRDEWPQRYAVASPVDALPVGVPVTAVHGSADLVVSPVQSSSYVARARAAGDPARLVGLPGVGHAGVVDRADPAWDRVRELLLAQVRGPA
ncbi:alpha/beta fold hydrolase [Rhodococcus aerolatus]